MAEPRIDPERLAALIDGRLDETAAAALRRELANADADTLSAYADAVAVAESMRGAGGADAPAGVLPIASARPTRRWLTPALGAIAAGIVFVALVRTNQGGSPRSTIGDVGGGFATGALPVPEWSTVRSGDGAMTDRGRAVRLGVLLMEYELAARRGDSAATSRAAMIASLLETIPGGSAAAMRWKSVAAGPPLRDDTVRGAAVGIAQSLVDPDFAQLGAWLESARTAAAARRGDWFGAREQPVRPPLPAAAAGTLSVTEREAVAAVERAVAARPLDFAALSAAIEAAEKVLSR